LGFQAFGQQIVFPYNYLAAPSLNEVRFRSLADQVVQAIRSAPNQRTYQVGAGGILNGVERGTSLDYAYERGLITYAFTMRLPRGPGANGFIFPEADLARTLSETFRGFEVLANYVQTLA
jgi:hypothetical protein